MKKIFIKIIFISLLFPQIGQAEFKENLRNYSEKLLGSELTIKFFGEKEQKIKLPKIPKVDDSAKSLKVYEKNEKRNIKPLDSEVERKSNLSFIVEIYKVTREKKPSKEELAQWINALSQGGTREGLYRALVLDETYAGLENFGSSVNDKVTNFAVEYLGDFLDKEAGKKAISNSNFYTLKRVVTEKTLEVLDEFVLSNQEDLFKWYAVFSGEFAKKYPGVWQIPARQSISRESHLEWCKTVPIQHIKSEVIIKIHKVFNSLK